MDKKKIIQVGITVAAVFLCGILYLVAGPGRGSTDTKDSFTAGKTSAVSEASVKTSKEAGKTYIYICGEVKKPGVYIFKQDPRVADVLKKAGGFTKKADKTAINLAEAVSDGSQIIVPGKSSKKEGKSSGTTDETGSEETEDRRININTASREELMKIPGIGEAKASMIETYRQEHGRFQKTEDIMNISGIKEGIYNRIKDYIRV